MEDEDMSSIFEGRLLTLRETCYSSLLRTHLTLPYQSRHGVN